MPTPKRERVQFKERTELLDFLLEVAAVTAGDTRSRSPAAGGG